MLFDAGTGKCRKAVVAKTTVNVNSVQNVLRHIYVQRIKFAQTGKLLFDSHQLLLVSEVSKKIFIGGVAERT